jgi:hypothetical protein
MSTGDKFLKRDLLPFFVCRKIKVRFLFLFYPAHTGIGAGNVRPGNGAREPSGRTLSVIADFHVPMRSIFLLNRKGE